MRRYPRLSKDTGCYRPSFLAGRERRATSSMPQMGVMLKFQNIKTMCWHFANFRLTLKAVIILIRVRPTQLIHL